MLWFDKKNKRRLEMAKQGLQATSKTSLKLQCLFCAKGDLKEAKELYDFFAADMPNLPDQDPVPPTWMDNTKETVNGILGWVRENQDTLAQAYDFVRGIVQRKPMVPPSGVEDAASLPPINE
jgi:hypothetical protein